MAGAAIAILHLHDGSLVDANDATREHVAAAVHAYVPRSRSVIAHDRSAAATAMTMVTYDYAVAATTTTMSTTTATSRKCSRGHQHQEHNRCNSKCASHGAQTSPEDMWV